MNAVYTDTRFRTGIKLAKSGLMPDNHPVMKLAAIKPESVIRWWTRVRQRGLGLGWEIGIALLLKLLLIIGFKLVFFSAPLPKQQAANEVANVFSHAPVTVQTERTPGTTAQSLPRTSP